MWGSGDVCQASWHMLVFFWFFLRLYSFLLKTSGARTNQAHTTSSSEILLF